MGYRVRYDGKGNARKVQTYEKWKPLYTCVLVIVFVTVCLLTDAGEWLGSILFPGDPAATEMALNTMLTSLREGESLSEAVTTFCRDILDNAGIS